MAAVSIPGFRPTRGAGGYGGGYGGGGRSSQLASTANRQYNTGASRKTQGGGGQGVPQLPYQPGAPQTQGLISQLSEAGGGLLDPNSQYSTRLREQMVGGIGQQTEAMQRGAALQASRAGFGTGAGTELLETQGDIGRTGLEAQGQAAADMTLQAPQIGGQLMRPALSAQLGLQGQSLQGYMGQQQIGAQQQGQIFQAQLAEQQMEQERQMQEAQMQMQAQQLQQQQYLREMGYFYGGY